MLPKRLLRAPLGRRLSRPTEEPITSARRLQIWSERLIIVALSLWLAGCNNQQPAAQGPPPAEVTVSKPEQKEVVNWNEFTGRTAALKLVKVTPRVSGYIVDIPFKEGDNGIIKVRPDSPVRPQPGAMEQFSSSDISMPLISSPSSASHTGTERNQATP